MTTGAAVHGRAKGLLAAARRHESNGDAEAAGRIYLDAAAAFVDAAMSSGDAATRRFRMDLAFSAHERGRRLVTPPAPVATVASAGPALSDAPGLPIPVAAPSVVFDDVVGMEDVKRELHRRIVLPLEHPDIFRKYGKTAGGGVLLYGPPGCGKTFIARAAAGESGASFFPVQLADVLDQYVGGSEKALKAVFDAARAHRPSIVFLDEIDAIGASRTGQQTDHGRRLLNQLLTLMDGATSSLDGILVIGATNVPELLDPALVRPGRFSARVEIPMPAQDVLVRIALKQLAPLDWSEAEIHAEVTERGLRTPAEVDGWCDEVVMARIEAEIGGRA